MAEIRLQNQSTPAIPPSGRTTLYIDSNDKHCKQIDDTGAVIDLSVSGAATTSSGSWTYDASTAQGDPGAGNLRLNALPASATACYISATASNGIDMTSVLSATRSGATFHLSDPDNGGNASLYLTDDRAIDNATWFEIPLTNQDNAGTLLTGNLIGLALLTGAGTITSTSAWKFDNSTTAADPGEGKFRLNNADHTIATALYLNETSDAGVDVSLILDTIVSGDSCFIQETADASRAVLYSVSGLPTDNGAWRTIPLTFSSIGNNTIRNGNLCAVTFEHQAAAAQAEVAAALADLEALKVYGALFQNGPNLLVIPAVDTDVAVDGWSAAALFNTTLIGTTELEAGVTGVYEAMWALSIRGVAKDVFEASIAVNGVRQVEAIGEGEISNDQETEHFSGFGTFAFTAGDDISVVIRNVTNSNNVTVQHGQMLLKGVGT